MVVDLRGQLSNSSPALRQLADPDIGSPPGSSVPTPRPTPRTARRLKPDEVEAMLAAYRTGRTMKELATEFGVSRQTVAVHLRRAKAPVRRRGLSQKQATEVVSLYETGWTSRELAERYGVSTDTVLRTLHRHGVKIRSRHGNGTLGRL